MRIYEKKRVARTYVRNMFKDWCAIDGEQLEGAMIDCGYGDVVSSPQDYADIRKVIAVQIELLIRRYDVKGGK